MSNEKTLNELKKATLASYLSKAGGRIRSATKIAGDFDNDYGKAMATANKHSPNVYTPGFEKDPEKFKKAETKMKVAGDLRDTFKRDAYNRIKGIARAGRLMAKEETINERNTESHPSLWDTHELRHESGKALKKGDKVKGFRGTYKIQGFEMPHHEGSTGRVYTDKGSFFPSVVNAKIVKKSVSEETLDEVNIVKKIKRGLAGWGAFDKDSPRELVNRHKAYDTQTLKNLKTNKKTGKGSPAELQQKVIKRELKKRVGLEESEQVNEVSRSTIAKVAQARYNQAQKALKDKNYPEYVKKIQKSHKAADATIPKSGWSPEDEPILQRQAYRGMVGGNKNEEVSPQEKYRQIREAKVRRVVEGTAVPSTTTHHPYYVHHEDLKKASKALTKAGIAHGVHDHSKAPVDHSVISVRHKHTEKANKVLDKHNIDYGARTP